MYERILVPLDGSEEAERVLPHVIELARKFSSEVHLMQATTWSQQLASESANPQAPELGMDIARRRHDSEKEKAAAYLEQVASRLTSEGINATTVVTDGPAETAIIDQASGISPALLAMTTHGRGGISRLVFGSVADAVVQKSPIPVLLVRLTKD